MTEQQEFYIRCTLSAVFAISLITTAFHRVRASATREKISRAHEGRFFAILLRAMGFLLIVATLTYLIAPSMMRFSQWPLPAWGRWGFAIASFAGCWFMYWTLTSLGNNLTDTVHVRQNATLVTWGPYRWVRHPFYFTTAWLMACVSLASANWVIGLLSIIVVTLLFVRTTKEEEMLVARFGDAYREYCKTTGQFLPSLWKHKS